MSNASAFKLDALDTRIKELVTYARERGGEDRSLLFRNLIDLFLTGKAPQKQPTRQQLINVIGALIPHVEEESRRTVAELLAHMSSPPLDLAVCLAKDNPSVVGPLLKSQAFDESDIIEIIAHTGRDHHQAIASRNDLSANVWIALARAAPKAAEYKQSASLSLWSEDLGTHNNVEEPQKATVTQLHPEQQTSESIVDYSASWQMTEQPADLKTTQPGDNRINSGHESVAEHSARQAASLRILRTDKDLISERIENANSAALSMATDRDYMGKADPEKDLRDALRPSDKEEYITNTAAEDSWSWRSDRDGIVTAVSEKAGYYLSHADRFVGQTILDVLSLNTKLGHPVSRAFQRRSAIHGAPIIFDTEKETSKHWTLDAKPVFSTGGGTFEGYQGQMTLVASHEKDKYEINSIDMGANTVFLDEQTFQGREAAPRTTITDENIDRTRTPAPTIETKKIQQPSDTFSNITTEALMAETAANAVKDVLAETLSSMLQSTQPKQPDPTSAKEPTSEIAATLQLLEEAISKLAETKSTGSAAPARLQAEIAAACLRSLKEQLDLDKAQ